MELTVGTIFEGRVTGITKFGAFVALPGGGNGLVHISEIAGTYVSDVHDFLTEGQTVRVKVLGFGDGGKVNLSIKKALPENETSRSAPPRPRPQPPRPAPVRAPVMDAALYPPDQGAVHGPSSDAGFEDKLKQFMQESEGRISGNKLYNDRRGSSRRRK